MRGRRWGCAVASHASRLAPPLPTLLADSTPSRVATTSSSRRDLGLRARSSNRIDPRSAVRHSLRLRKWRGREREPGDPSMLFWGGTRQILGGGSASFKQLRAANRAQERAVRASHRAPRRSVGPRLRRRMAGPRMRSARGSRGRAVDHTELSQTWTRLRMHEQTTLRPRSARRIHQRAFILQGPKPHAYNISDPHARQCSAASGPAESCRLEPAGSSRVEDAGKQPKLSQSHGTNRSEGRPGDGDAYSETHRRET
jgi:hypothetical protein